MKTLTVSEIDNVLTAITPLMGCRLQTVKAGEKDFALGFYTSSGILWLWVDLNGISPSVLPWSEWPAPLIQRSSPLQLFLKAHFVGRSMETLQRLEEWGRVVVMKFTGGGELELRLFPQARNFIARANGKQVSWDPVKPLEPVGPDHVSRPPRDLQALREEWLAGRKTSSKKSKALSPEERLERERRKKESAIAKIKVELKIKQESPWRQVGEWMKAHQSVEVPAEWAPFVDRRRKLAWNIENCFQKARENEAKIDGAERRLQQLEAELQRLQIAPPSHPTKKIKKPTIQVSGAQGRTWRIDEEMFVMTGKSAADNFKLLRQSRAWDLWLHLRDEPSRHAILFRNKSTQVAESTLHDVAAWLVRAHFGDKYKDHQGERIAVVVAECRHVRPIKGDRIGRVTYRNERILIHRVP